MSTKIEILNLILLTLTLIVLFLYAVDTHRIANQSQEDSLRPVVLRSGFIETWQTIKFSFDDERKLTSGKPLEFTVLKNIATDISGYIVIDGFKYKLHFGNDISKNSENSVYFSEKWGWMKPDTRIFAIFTENDKEKTNNSNEIYLSYKDVEGNEYYTVENSNFSSRVYKK